MTIVILVELCVVENRLWEWKAAGEESFSSSTDVMLNYYGKLLRRVYG